MSVCQIARVTHLGGPVWDVPGLLVRSVLLVPAQLPQAGLQIEEALVDGLALLHALPGVARPVRPLIARQVHKGQPAPGRQRAACTPKSSV